RVVGPPRDRSADPGPGKVGEVGAGLAVLRGEGRAADVDGAHSAAARHLERGVEATGDPEAAGEVLARAEREDGQLDGLSESGLKESVCDLVHRSVASDDDELSRTAGSRLCGQLAQMAGPLGEERV